MKMFEEKGEPKRGVEPASIRLPAERLNHQAQAGSHYKQRGSVSFVKHNFCLVMKALLELIKNEEHVP